MAGKSTVPREISARALLARPMGKAQAGVRCSDMTAEATAERSPVAPLWGELRYGRELARLLIDGGLRPRPHPAAQPVMLIPGFMAGDDSLTILRNWLRRRGNPVSRSGIRANVDCAERAVSRLEAHLRDIASDAGRPVLLIGQSRGGALARSLTVRCPELVSGLVMLGSPVRVPPAFPPPVLSAARGVPRLGALGLPGVLSSNCAEGACCETFREELTAPL